MKLRYEITLSEDEKTLTKKNFSTEKCKAINHCRYILGMILGLKTIRGCANLF